MTDSTERQEKFPGQRTPGGWRPDDYLERPPRDQWRIDENLGILDWDGTWPDEQQSAVDAYIRTWPEWERRAAEALLAEATRP